ncbi:MAG: hypothetical protein CMF41_02190 [Legionellales bacterium]|nr:hypothetical protein [Legionellales bacterium]OUX65790.1 MAG: hypothetical protein CBE41_01255 [Gammaproteobacteria bacterium TMED281]
MTAFLYSILGGGMGWMISNVYGARWDVFLSKRDVFMMNFIISFIMGFGFYLPEPFQSIVIVAAFSRVYAIGLIWNEGFLNPYQKKQFFELSLSALTTLLAGVMGYYTIASSMYLNLIIHQIIQ